MDEVKPHIEGGDVIINDDWISVVWSDEIGLAIAGEREFPDGNKRFLWVVFH